MYIPSASYTANSGNNLKQEGSISTEYFDRNQPGCTNPAGAMNINEHQSMPNIGGVAKPSANPNQMSFGLAPAEPASKLSNKHSSQLTKVAESKRRPKIKIEELQKYSSAVLFN